MFINKSVLEINNTFTTINLGSSDLSSSTHKMNTNNITVSTSFKGFEVRDIKDSDNLDLKDEYPDF